MHSRLFNPIAVIFGKFINAQLVHEIQFLKAENAILKSRIEKRIVLTPQERSRLVKLGRRLGESIKDIISIVKYETFKRWLREENGVKGEGAKRFGRPRKPLELRELVLTLARENNWGYERILGELGKLGINDICKTTIKNILKEAGVYPDPNREAGLWDNFLKRHWDTLWACDFFTQKVLTLKGPVVFYILFFMELKTRKITFVNMTQHPNSRWVNQQARNLAFVFDDEGKVPRYLLRDRDSKFTNLFDEILSDEGVEILKLPFRSPDLNSYAEAWIKNARRECLNHFVIIGEQHLRYLVKSYVTFFNNHRPHRGLGNRTIPTAKSGTEPVPVDYVGKIQKEAFLGGLLNHYYRAA